MEEFYTLVDSAIDAAFEKNMFLFKAYQYLIHSKIKRVEIQEFIDSTTAKQLALTISDLDAYVKGGSDSYHQQLREAYGHLGKPKARKISKYLSQILIDARQYEWWKRPGRRKTSK